ncbi:hypothetical protein WOC_02516 [Enterococcus faecalis EnGen0357]|nr:hypothetical protein WOC_02516 [Enterococcus faecalis EnGen0357]
MYGVERGKTWRSYLFSIAKKMNFKKLPIAIEDYEIPANLEELTINQKPFFQNAKNIFYTLEQFYRIEISNWELYVIYEILSSR